MEATKKKKAYLKPEMSRLEVKTQEFIAGSKPIIEVDEDTFIIGTGIPSCFSQGTSNGVAPTLNACFQMNSAFMNAKCYKEEITLSDGTKSTVGKEFEKAGLEPGKFYKVIEINTYSFKCRESTEACN